MLAPCLAQRVQRVQIFPPARSSRLEKEDNICTLIKKRPLQLLQIVLLLDLPPEWSFKQRVFPRQNKRHWLLWFFIWLHQIRILQAFCSSVMHRCAHAIYVNPRESLRALESMQARLHDFLIREQRWIIPLFYIEADRPRTGSPDPHSCLAPHMPHINFSCRLFSFRGDRWQSIKQRQQTTGSIVLCLLAKSEEKEITDSCGSTFCFDFAFFTTRFQIWEKFSLTIRPLVILVKNTSR